MKDLKEEINNILEGIETDGHPDDGYWISSKSLEIAANRLVELFIEFKTAQDV